MNGLTEAQMEREKGDTETQEAERGGVSGPGLPDGRVQVAVQSATLSPAQWAHTLRERTCWGTVWAVWSS